jgi:prolyl 4-hydroxylase
MPSDKPLITAFPPLYNVDNKQQKTYFHINDFNQVNSALPTEWSSGGWINHRHEVVPENNIFPRIERILCGALVFTTGEWVNVVRQDPNFLYVGEEFALTLRSFTHGYDLFVPNRIVCWHRNHPEPNRKFRHDNPEEVCKELHNGAIDRLKKLMRGDTENVLGRFGLGKKRTIEEFGLLTGIDCNNQTLSSQALEGDICLPNDLSEGLVDQKSGLSATKMGDIENEKGQTVNFPINEIQGNEQSNSLIEITINTKSMAPLMLVCEETAPVLSSLFFALNNRVKQPESLVYLELGDTGQEKVFFKANELVSIETTPSLSPQFFANLDIDKIEKTTKPITDDQVDNLQFDDQWKFWIWDNVNRGCSKDHIFKQLVDHGFAYQQIKRELNHEPSQPLSEIELPTEIRQEVPDCHPNAIAQRLDVNEIPIFYVDNFLNESECSELLSIIMANHQRSSVVEEDGRAVSEYRTSSSCVFSIDDEEHALAFEVRERICRIIGVDMAHSEPIQGQLYKTGQEYKAHHDWFAPNTKGHELEASDEQGGQRTWSVIVYLNEVEKGGETYFESVDLTLVPKLGRLVYWHNLYSDQTPNPLTLHQAKPVESGYKAILTLWFRQKAFNNLGLNAVRPWDDGSPDFSIQACDSVPAFTKNGFEKTHMPFGLFDELVDAYQNQPEENKKDEDNRFHFMANQEQKPVARLVEIPQILRQKIIREFQPICQNWSKQELEFSSLYGIREYSRGTSLKIHHDRIETHIISVIINLAQDVEEEWPLLIEDHVRRQHEVFLQPGEALLYEGARLRHGRPLPLEGDSFANIFVHFKPKV